MKRVQCSIVMILHCIILTEKVNDCNKKIIGYNICRKGCKLMFLRHHSGYNLCYIIKEEKNHEI